jgi:N-acetyl-beta-hexosaminidase
LKTNFSSFNQPDMNKKFAVLLLTMGFSLAAFGQEKNDSQLPVRGFAIGAPEPQDVAQFVKFINEELAPRQINTLILRVDYSFQYESHPELRDSIALSKGDVKQILTACKKNRIDVVPQINLLGHQSWANRTSSLLRVYPQFDETPWVKMPESYKWPNEDGLYCKSYCPLHPEVHKVLFEIIDEVCDAFESTAFHAGMDEVFYIGENKCPRCSGLDKAELFANEVRTIRDHLAQKNRRLWIWGDRLLDGKQTGLGMWEASMNNTHRAIDMIPRDVLICDWHYERPDKTAVYFAMKGFDVVTCPWRKPAVGTVQYKDMINYRTTATPIMKDRYKGIVQTVWSDAGSFMDGFYGKQKDEKGGDETAWNSFTALFSKPAKPSK